MANFTPNLPMFMGLDAWTDKTQGLHFAHTNPNDRWAVYLAANTFVRAAAVHIPNNNMYSIYFVSEIQYASGYTWTDNNQKTSTSLSTFDVSRNIYYGKGWEIPLWFSGEPFYGTFDSVDDMLDAYKAALPNPYDINGNTIPAGGDGTGYENLVNDPVDFPTLPSISAADAGFVSIWTPTKKQVKDLAKYLWTTDITTGSFWKKLIQNPLDLIFGLYIMPIPIWHTDESGTMPEGYYQAANDNVILGWTNTRMKMDYIPLQYIEVDMGSIDVEECWGAFLDYEPYTKIDIYLPYIGVKSLDTNECMPKTVALKYMIDLATGTCIALIKCDNSVYYHFVGNCASQIPLTAVQMQEVVKGVMSIAVGAASFGIGGVMGAGAHASKAAITKGAAMQAAGAAMAGSGADSIAKGPRYSHSGTMAASAGIMDVQTPYLIFSRPKQAIPEDQQKYTGYPSFITKELSELEGYTEVQIIHLHNMSCTTDEVNEIEQLLLSGVIF